MSETVSRGKAPRFRKNTFTGRSEMFCPDCGEEIEQVDVESYLHCPFCNCVLKQNDEFDDFLLDDVIRAWVAKNNQSAKG